MKYIFLKLRIGLFSLLLVVLFSCKEERVYIDSRISDYAVYNNNATWVIEDSISSTFDTLVLISQNTFFEGSGGYEYEQLRQIFNLRRFDSSLFELSCYYDSREKFCRIGFTYKDSLYFDNSFLFGYIILNSASTYGYSTILSSQNVNGSTYNNVLYCELYLNPSEDTLRFWWIKDEGLIRSECISMGGILTNVYKFNKIN